MSLNVMVSVVGTENFFKCQDIITFRILFQNINQFWM